MVFDEVRVFHKFFLKYVCLVERKAVALQVSVFSLQYQVRSRAMRELSLRAPEQCRLGHANGQLMMSNFEYLEKFLESIACRLFGISESRVAPALAKLIKVRGFMICHYLPGTNPSANGKPLFAACI